MRIGVDFDNTIICYDQAFYSAARAERLIPDTLPQTKQAVRDCLRSTGRESEWTRLQGLTYGLHIGEAAPFPGALEFLGLARDLGHILFLVSHKTRYPIVGDPHDLHAAAVAWLTAHRLANTEESPLTAIFFEPTKEEKLTRIDALQCDVFVDDLPEILLAPAFPVNTRRCLFDPHKALPPTDQLDTFHSWDALHRSLLTATASVIARGEDRR